MSLLINTAVAQIFPGYQNSNHAGIYGVMTNPASAAGYRYKWDINIVGVNVNAGNTYLSFPKSILLHPADTLYRNRDFFLDSAASRQQNGWGMADIMMPSVLYAIDRKQSISFVWRMRSNINAGNPSTPITNFFGIDFPNVRYIHTNFYVPNAAVSAHIWHELGLSYARVLKEGYASRWKAGITVKLLSGIAAGYAAAKNVNFTLNTTQDATITSGTFYIGYNKELDNWASPVQRNLKLFNNSSIGADIGVIYEFRPDNDGFGAYDGTDADDYKLRIGVSITDIGRIKYNKSADNTDLTLVKKNVQPNDITLKKNESLQQYHQRMNQYFTPLESDATFTMALPTALNLMSDYNFDNRFFMSASALISLNAGKSTIAKTYALTQFSVTPRYESRLFGAYLPLTINHNMQADAGMGIRLGPLLLGSYTIFSNLLDKRIDHADAFAAIRLNPSMFRHKRAGKHNRQANCPAK